MRRGRVARVNGDDVLVTKIGGGSRFLQEPLLHLPFGKRGIVQHFDGHGTLQQRIGAALDDTHATAPDDAGHHVLADLLRGRAHAASADSIAFPAYPAYSSSPTGSSHVVAALTFTAMCVPALPGAAPCQ